MIFAAYFILRGHDTHFLRLLLFVVGMIVAAALLFSLSLVAGALLNARAFLSPLLKCNASRSG